MSRFQRLRPQPPYKGTAKHRNPKDVVKRDTPKNTNTVNMFKIKIKGGHTIYNITSFTADEYKFKLIYKGPEACGDLSLSLIESIEKQ